jgi:hypothetical protein
MISRSGQLIAMAQSIAIIAARKNAVAVRSRTSKKKTSRANYKHGFKQSRFVIGTPIGC